ncbi:hypothetical protein DSM112329_00036 [Paraconexibacter sp. AEG42_29]|uniref:Uncharacterized protein n=1 Tax=Paraconexibacter sp. AEG42_29 TaxID=2997339 RepID=A0AAU7ANQ0_9ACTN
MSFPIGTPPPGASPGAYGIDSPSGRFQRTGDAGSTAPAAPSFARVYELEEARRRRDLPLPPIAGDRIPTEVWDEVEAASRLFDQLKSEGRQVMFDNDRLTGRVVASLLDSDGAVSRLPLATAVDPQPTTSTAPTNSAAGAAAAYGHSDGVA